VTPALQFPALGDREFQTISERVYRRTGICFVPAKKALIAGRLQRRLRELGLRDFAAYLRVVLADPAEETRMLECLCTHETSFFREPHHFELLARQVLPRWLEQAERGLRPRRARVLSAGCSSGEEPYSIAMTLAAALPGWSIEVLGGDLSARIVEHAAVGEWPLSRASQIPDHHLRRFILRGVGENQGVMRASPELRALLRFTILNLGAAAHPGLGQFDLIFCRNVLIYFDNASRERAILGLLPHLAHDGLFFVGHAESLAGFTERLAAVVPTVYRHKSAA